MSWKKSPPGTYFHPKTIVTEFEILFKTEFCTILPILAINDLVTLKNDREKKRLCLKAQPELCKHILSKQTHFTEKASAVNV